LSAGAATLRINVGAAAGAASSATMYGIMFEDINFSGDGGLYAELIRNRAFQGASTSVSPWTAVGGARLSLSTTQPLSSALPKALAVASGSGAVGFANPGYWGFDVKVQPYTGSFYVLGDYAGNFTASFQSIGSKETLGSVDVVSAATSAGWVQHSFTLVPTKAAANSNNTFSITYNASGVKGGSLSFNLVSLFPPTYKNRPNGLRKDLMEALAEMKPSILRFPGGNNLEGEAPPNYWKWQNTVGPLKDRPGRMGTWSYQNTDGLGLVEYMQWCEDLGMEPLLATWAGLYLGGSLTPQSGLQPYVDDFLDELEFLMGDAATTKYGAQRASILGHARPWRVNFVEIGNEDNLNGGPASYTAYRFPMFYNAIKAKYPNMTVVASMETKSLPGDAAQDYHTYSQPKSMIGDFAKFDRYDRKHKVIVGEYANINRDSASNMWSNRPLYPFWKGSVSEAVLAIGAERNGDVVIGLTYAPLFCNLNSHQWTPDLIGDDWTAYTADPAQTVKSTSHAVIKLLSSVRITHLLSMTGDPPKPVYYVAGLNAATGSRVVKTAVYGSPSEAAVSMTVAFAGDAVAAGAAATLTVLTAPGGENSSNAVGSIAAVKTETTTLTAGAGGVFTYSLPDLSVSVLEVKG
ncbi:putative vacuolar segregation protein, partial [Lasiosphaeria miniovina]